MNNWIEEEAEKFHLEKEERQKKEDLINNSNHWTLLRQQVEKDVGEINNHAVWKEILGGIPLVIQNNTDGFQIQKTTVPAVYVTIRNQDRQIEMVTEIKETEAEANGTREILPVDVEDGNVVLKSRETSYLVPDQAARYILSPIIKALRK